MKNKKIYVVLLALMIVACSKKETATETKAPEPIEVETAVAEARTVEKTISVTGELQAEESVNISLEVAGRVAKIHYDFGQFVKKGAVIAELDAREYQIQVDRARAMLNQALARIGLNASDVNVTPTTSPSIRQAEAQLADAKSKYDSAAQLIKTGDIARERFVELEKALQARQAALDATRDELRTLAANVESLKAELRLAEKRVADTVIRAPFDGAVAERMVSPGEYIKENVAIVRLVKADTLRLRFDVPESAASVVRVGSNLTFSTDAVTGKTFNATVRELNPSLNQNSRTLTAEARIANPNRQLKPGLFVQVNLITAKDVSITTIPTKALYRVAGLTKAFAIRNGKAVEFHVPPGIEEESWVEVPERSIQPGEQVAISSIGSLINEMPVRTR